MAHCGNSLGRCCRMGTDVYNTRHEEYVISVSHLDIYWDSTVQRVVTTFRNKGNGRSIPLCSKPVIDNDEDGHNFLNMLGL
jgi:hypothetical protein